MKKQKSHTALCTNRLVLNKKLFKRAYHLFQPLATVATVSFSLFYKGFILGYIPRVDCSLPVPTETPILLM